MRLTLLIVLLAAAAERPEWLRDPSREFPRAGFMTAVGEGPSQEKAADKARAELAKSFSLTVAAQTRSYASETVAGKASAFEAEVSEEVRTSTEKVLEGVDVPKFWQDGDTHFALAVLDRVHGLSTLKDKLAELDAEASRLAADLPAAEGKFARLKLAVRLTELLKSRRFLNSDYRQLSPDGKGIPAPEAAVKAQESARKAVASVSIRVEAVTDASEAAALRLSQALSRRGLRAGLRGPESADLVVRVEGESELEKPRDLTWYWARGRLGVEVNRPLTGETALRFEEAGEDAARDPSRSSGVVLRTLADKSAGRVYAFVTSGRLLDD